MCQCECCHIYEARITPNPLPSTVWVWYYSAPARDNFGGSSGIGVVSLVDSTLAAHSLRLHKSTLRGIGFARSNLRVVGGQIGPVGRG